MDDLLRRLRHDMAELWSQGEDYTHQIWLMYGEFEQVVDRLRVCERRENAFDWMKSMMDSTTGSGDRFDISDYESDNEPEVPSMMNRVYGITSSKVQQRAGLNPLLDTISVIGDLCDSDDAIDGPVTGCLYAGSNSVDSGYKSACPTPDLDNYVVQHQHQQQQRPPAIKPRRLVPAPLPADDDDAESAPPLDLDHLASLRQTLLSAIERYDLRTKQIDRDLQTTMAERRPRSASPALADSKTAAAATATAAANVRLLISEAAKMHSSHQGRAEQEPGSGGGDGQQQQDGAVRFSRVARCMLEIIEDLQRQQQQQQQQQPNNPDVAATTSTNGQDAVNRTTGPKVPPKPVRMSIQNKLASSSNVSASLVSGIPAPATPPRVARRGRRKLPTPQPPPSDDEDDDNDSVKPVQLDLSGADYHLYEEIIYDLGPSHAAANKNATNQTEVPPPLPARPSRHHPAAVSSPVAACVQPFGCPKPWLSAIKPFRRDRNNQLVRQTSGHSNGSAGSGHQWTATKLHIDRPPRSNNFYTFSSSSSSSATGQQHQPCLSTSLKNLIHHHEDEYGFRAPPVSHMV